MKVNMPMIGVMVIMAGTVIGEDTSRVLFDFSKPEASKEWQPVNDGVMGELLSGLQCDESFE